RAKTFGLNLRLKMCATSARCRDQSPRAEYWSIATSVPRTATRTVSPVSLVFAHGLRNHHGSFLSAAGAGGQVCRIIAHERRPTSGDSAMEIRKNIFSFSNPLLLRTQFVERLDRCPDFQTDLGVWVHVLKPIHQYGIFGTQLSPQFVRLQRQL